MNYSGNKLEDFLTDEFFIHWVKSPDEESNAYWNAYLSQHPEKDAMIREARSIILMLQFKETQAPEGKFLEIWERISEGETRTLEVSSAFEAPADQRLFRNWYKVAAVFLLIAATFVYMLVLKGPGTVTIETAYGESRVLFLPDSTKVTLNANSVLRYASDFSQKSREVWLEGEAFFAVVRKKNNQNFRVHTHELQVEVLGTRFNVNTRRGKSSVALEEGKVKLGIPAGGKTSELIMEPGELVEVAAATKVIERKRVDVSSYSSWRTNKLFFVGTSLKEIAQLLEDNYGFRVQFLDESLKERRFTGSSSLDDPAELIKKLNKVFGLNIRHHGNDVVIQY